MKKKSKRKIIFNEIILGIRQVIKKKEAQLHEPTLSRNVLINLKKCVKTNMLSSVGPFVSKFEDMIKDYTRSKFAIATVNGTSALHISLILSGVKKTNEVIIPAVNFIASANVISYLGARPLFMDIDESTLGLDTDKLRIFLKENTYQKSKNCINKKTQNIIKGIIVLHAFGHPSKLDELLKLSMDYNIKLIEDSAEALGSEYFGKHVGTFGRFGVLSFNGNKIITTGGGGMILTNLKELANKAYHISRTAKINHPWKYIYDQVGYNYRMPNINASIGCAQMENIKSLIKKKRLLYKRYQEKFLNIKDAFIFKEPKNCKSNYWLQCMIFKKNNKKYTDDFVRECHLNKIFVRPLWELNNLLPHFKIFEKYNLKISYKIYKNLVNLPSSSFL